jgi:N-acetylglucosaminyl-diphospho-decaprenol L-rhamnosyltransferase
MIVSVPVYVVHWNAPQWCAATVASFLGSDGVDVTVCVVDNGPPECSDELRALLPPGVRIIASKSNAGFTGGANVGIRDWLGRSDGRLIVIASHDVRFEPQSLRTLVQAMDDADRAGIRLGVLGPQGGRIGDPIDDRSGLHAIIEPTGWVSGSCMLLRRDCVLDVGPFDERFGSYFEDVDYGMRAGDLGWQVGRMIGITMGFNGSRSSLAHRLSHRNDLLLAFKRGGAAGAVRRGSSFVVPMLRNGVGALALWRSPAERAVSRHRFESRAAALPAAVREVRRHGTDSWRSERAVPAQW